MVILAALAVLEAYAAVNTRGRIERKPGRDPVNPLLVARFVVLAKASSLAAAIFAGFYAGLAGWLFLGKPTEAAADDRPTAPAGCSRRWRWSRRRSGWNAPAGCRSVRGRRRARRPDERGEPARPALSRGLRRAPARVRCLRPESNGRPGPPARRTWTSGHVGGAAHRVTTNRGGSPRRVLGGDPAAVLENVFDDPAHGDPGRDRLVVHLVWETCSSSRSAAVAYLLWREAPDTLRGDGLRGLLTDGVVLGLLALAAGLSLRAATVNLAIGPVAVAAALHMAEQGDRGLAAAVGPAAAVATLGGLVLALVVVVCTCPPGPPVWPARPGWSSTSSSGPARSCPRARTTRTGRAPLFAGFAAVAVLGRRVRRGAGGASDDRPVPPGRRPGPAAGLRGGARRSRRDRRLDACWRSLAGLLLGTAGAGPVTPGSGLDWTVLAVGTALLAGTSAYGRRGGIFGTLLAVSLVTVVLAYADARGWTVNRWALGAVDTGDRAGGHPGGRGVRPAGLGAGAPPSPGRPDQHRLDGAPRRPARHLAARAAGDGPPRSRSTRGTSAAGSGHRWDTEDR